MADNSLVSNIQSKVQNAKKQIEKGLEIATTALKEGSTQTPKASETPKVTSEPKATPSTTTAQGTINISKTPQTYGPTAPVKTSDVVNLFGNNKNTGLIGTMATDLFTKGTEDKTIVPTSLVNTANAQGGAVKETVDKTVFQQFSDWFNKPREDITKQTADLFVSKVDEEGIHLQKRAENFFMQGTEFINNAEFAILKTIDVASKELGLDTGLTEDLDRQFSYWENYSEERGEEALKKYESDTKAQDLKDRVSWEMLKLTEDKELSDKIGNAVGRVYSTATDPEEIAATVGYMLPGILARWATGGGFWAGTAVFAPSYATEAYQDLSKDKDITDNWGDTGVRSASVAIGTLQAMIEELADALGNMPWAKGFSKELSSLFTKNLKKDIVKGGEKVFMEEIDKIADKTIVKELRKGFKEILKDWFRGSVGEGVEEVVQDVIQTEGAILLGSERDHMDLETALTDYFLGQVMGLEIMAPGVAVNFKKNQDLKKEYNKFSEEIDKVAPGINEETKQMFFSAMITSQQNDANLSEKQISKYEEQTTKLYEERAMLEQRLRQADNDEVRDKINGMIEQTDNKIKEIDKKINQWENTREQINKAIEEYNLTNKQETQLPAEVGGENMSEQAMGSIDTVSQGEVDASESKKSFDKAIQEVKNGTEYYNTQFAKDYAYATSGKKIAGDTKQNQQLINKVKNLLNGIGIKMQFTNKLKKGTRGLYSQGIVYYKKGNKELTLYGHEVFHAMMDVINNGELDDKQLQSELQDILREAIEEVKKQLGIDSYKSGDELRYANKYAEERLANAFGEYLHNREIEGPKTFVQKIIDFFNKILDLFNSNKEKNLDDRLKYAFDKIVSGEVTGRRGIPKFVSEPSASINPIESSTEITQDAMKESNAEEYAEMNKEDKLQSKQQEELGEHGKEIVDAGKQSDYENEIYNESMDVELSQDVIDGKASTTPQTIRDAFGKDKKKRKGALSIMKTEALQAYHNIMTPARTRILNISPRIGGRLIQMEEQKDIYTRRYREMAKPFVEQISKLDKEAKLEIKKALLDYGALASEQGENIEQYKQEEIAKLKEVLNKYGISEQATNDMFSMLAELGQRYKDAGLSVTLSDIYFPRTVTDYEGLQQYISEQTGIPQEDKNTLLKRIEKITRDDTLTEEEKEKRIRHWMTTDYHEPGKTSKNAKERKMGLLSEWGEGIYQFYGDPIEALDSYIVTMEDAIQKQLFLGGLQEDAGLKGENVSLEEIVMGLVEQGKISNEKLQELKESISSVLNKKPTPKIVSSTKSMIHIGLLANFISAITQFDDLGVVILRDKSGLKNIVKALFGKAGIKYSDLGLENSYEIFKDQSNITNWFFAKSLFNWVDRLGKTSFINTAWESLKTQAKKNKDGTDTKSRKTLIKRLTDMYGEETANHIMEKIDSDNYMTNGQIDIDVLTDLLYLLSDTQPIYTSDMPTAYLNNGWVRLCYSLQTFLIKRINMLIQGAKRVYENNGGGAKGAVQAGVWLMYTTAFLAIWGAIVGDAQDFLKGDKDETTLYKLITEGIDAALDQLWKDSKGSWLKIWNLSDYDKKAYKRQGLWGWIMGKFEPPIIGMGEDFIEAITEHNEDEITDLAKYVPIVGKLLYYWFWDELGKETKSGWDWGDDNEWDWGDSKEFDWGDKKEWDWN